MSGNDKKEIERREKIDKTKEEIGEIEDTTKYGEFVSSYFASVSYTHLNILFTCINSR